MTKPLSLFLDTRTTLENVSNVLGDVTGCGLAMERLDVGSIYHATIFSIEMRLFEQHGLDDDCGIVFSAYSQQLMLTPLDTGLRTQGFDRMYESVAFFLGATLAERLSCPVILVANLQRQLAAFGKKEE